MIKTITYTPCDFFGIVGVCATLNSTVDGPCGYGETEDEALVEALMDSGLSFDAAFDAYGDVRDSAEIARPYAR